MYHEVTGHYKYRSIYLVHLCLISKHKNGLILSVQKTYIKKKIYESSMRLKNII